MKKIMVTGATGFLGSRLMAFLHTQSDVEVTAFAKGMLRAADENAINAQVEAFAPDAIIHTAAISDMGCCETNAEQSYLANVLLPKKLAGAALRQGAGFLFCSSDQVYNGTEGKGPFDETAPLHPKNVYARHKLEAEESVLMLLPSTVCLRLTWLYDLPVYGMPTHRNLLMNLLNAATHLQPLHFEENSYRGITYARQVAALLLPALALPGGAYNFGSENTLNMVETARAFLVAMGLQARVNELIVPQQSKPLESLAISCQKLTQNGICFDSTQEGIKRCMVDYQLAL